ncbi:unnamed protein product, partial [Prorocentrum cordatum]
GGTRVLGAHRRQTHGGLLDPGEQAAQRGRADADGAARQRFQRRPRSAGPAAPRDHRSGDREDV